MKKGFWHIIEILVVIVVVFFLLVQLAYIKEPESGIGDAKLVVQARDVLYSLDRQGIDWFNKSDVSMKLGFAFNNSNIVYSLRADNVVRPRIQVACFCDSQGFSRISAMLKGFSLNGRTVNFTLIKHDPSQTVFSEYYDVVILYNLSLRGEYNSMMSYLSSDKGILLIKDLRLSDFLAASDRKELEGVFGLNWTGDAESPSALEFSPAIDEKTLTYPIIRNFYAFPNSSGGKIAKPHVFQNFIAGERVTQKDGRQSFMVLAQSDTNHSGLIVNAGVSGGAGRTAWLSDGPDTDEREVLLKAVVAWLAGSTENILDNAMSRQVATVPFVKVYNKDMYEPVVITLTLGNRY